MIKLFKKIRRKLKIYWISPQVARKNRHYIQKLLGGNEDIKIELGESEKRKNMKGWSTIDLLIGSDICLDLSEPLPFPDNSVDMIYSSHLLEHFSYPSPMMDLLNECYRILKADGIFSVCVPNARIYVDIYLKPNKFNPDTLYHYKPAFNLNSSIDYLNHIAYVEGHHKHMFDPENLLAILKKAGFKNVRLRKFNPSLDRKERRHESIYAEATKQTKMKKPLDAPVLF